MGANHTLRNAFSSDLGFSKSKTLPSAKLCWGLEQPLFSFSRALTLIAIALEKFGSPELLSDKTHTLLTKKDQLTSKVPNSVGKILTI